MACTVRVSRLPHGITPRNPTNCPRTVDESSGGLDVKMTFARVIVWPEGAVTPKTLPVG